MSHRCVSNQFFCQGNSEEGVPQIHLIDQKRELTTVTEGKVKKMK